MQLLAELPAQCWILPVLLAVFWLLLWLMPVRRRTRMWFAGLAPMACFAGIVIGVVVMFAFDGNIVGEHCAEAEPCIGGHAAHWAYVLNSFSEVGLAIVANAVLAAAISLPLLVITAAVEFPRMAADRDVASPASRN